MFRFLFISSILWCLCPTDLIAQNFEWLKSVGGNNVDITRGVCIDNSGNIYITGTFENNTIIDGVVYNSNGATDIFLLKMNSAGNYSWVKTFGSGSFDYVFDIDNDANGHIAITGAFRNTMTLPGGIAITSVVSADEFTAEFDASGNCLWAKTGSGVTFDMGNEINITDHGNILSIGNTEDNITFDGTTLNHVDSTDVFFVKYGNSGLFKTAKLFGGIGYGQGRAISSDYNENILIAGVFTGQMIIGFDTLNSSSINDQDCFIAKLDSTGSAIWVKRYGNTGADYARGIDADANGNVYVSGVFSGTVSFGGSSLTSNGPSDIFLMKFSPVGNIIWLKQIGGNYSDEGCEIEVKDNGEVFITGEYSQSIAFPSSTFVSTGARDIFICKLDSAGNFIWSKSIGGPQDDVNYAIGVNRTNEEMVTVGTYSVSLTDSQTSIVSNGNIDSYISKINSQPTNVFLTQVDKYNGIVAYPNPARNSFSLINFNDDYSLRVIDVKGKLIFSKEMQNTESISAVTWSNGLYFLNIISGKNEFNIKIIIDR